MNVKLRQVDETAPLPDEMNELDKVIIEIHKILQVYLHDIINTKKEVIKKIGVLDFIIIVVTNVALNMANSFISEKIPPDARLKMIDDLGDGIKHALVNSWEALEALRSNTTTESIH